MEWNFLKIHYSKLPLYRSRRDLYYLFDITQFRYKGSYINGLEVLGGNIHFDISSHFVISDFDIEGVDCTLKMNHLQNLNVVLL